MNFKTTSLFRLSLVSQFITLSFVGATESQCNKDCRASNSSSPTGNKRPVGPTRPWHTRDELGEHLKLTRPYPYASTRHPTSATEIDVSSQRNLFSKFCDAGCSFFYSSKNQTTELSRCIGTCDEMYKYNVSVGYNDLAEIARLECRDGCQIALKRCQPGHFCTQVLADEKHRSYDRGIMHPCPSGTYRDVSYDAVEACLPCPPGRYREKARGPALESCSKCPINTYSSLFGSKTITDCIRCPAGKFAMEPGSASCKCITQDACSEEQQASPAHAEKRDTFSYNARR